MTYSFKFMETEGDKDMARKAMMDRLEKARQKLEMRKPAKIGALVRSGVPR